MIRIGRPIVIITAGYIVSIQGDWGGAGIGVEDESVTSAGFPAHLCMVTCIRKVYTSHTCCDQKGNCFDSVYLNSKQL